MKVTSLLLFYCLSCCFCSAQVSINQSAFFAKEFSKEQSLYKAKTFAINLLGATTDVIKFEVDPLAAANSGELTTLVYRCESKNKEGLILGFYGNRFNPAGVVYQEYGFKDLQTKQANDLLDKIETVTKENGKYIEANTDNNNVYFQFDDMTVLIYNTLGTTRLRIYWNDFDAELDWATFKKTKRRLSKVLQ